MNFFSSFFSKPNVEIIINEIPKRRNVYLRDEYHKRIKLPSFYNKENIEGEIIIYNKLYHNGIKIQIIGLIENKMDKKNNSQFIVLTKELSPPSNLISLFILFFIPYFLYYF